METERIFNSANRLADEAIAWAASLPIGEQFRKSNLGASLQLRCTLETFDTMEPYIVVVSQSVTVHESIRGRGICRRLFKGIENLSSVGIIVHEFVQNRFLRDRHKRHGFTCRGDDWQFFKRIGDPIAKSHEAYQFFLNQQSYIESRKKIRDLPKIGLGGERKTLVNLSFED